MRTLPTVKDRFLNEALGIIQTDGIKNVPLKTRFHVVALLLEGVKEIVPRIDEDDCVALSDREKSLTNTHVRLANAVLSTIDHSDRYKQFLNDSRVLTLQYIASDKNIMSMLENVNDTLLISNKDEIYEACHQYHVEASTHIANHMFTLMTHKFQQTPIKFFHEAKKISPNANIARVTRGLFDYNLKQGSRTIEINQHPNATKNNIIRVLGTLHHETIHDQGYQLGHAIYSGNGRTTGELFPDGLIWKTHAQAHIDIPSALNSTYRCQCIEDVAFAQQEKFEDGLQKLIYATPSQKIA